MRGIAGTQAPQRGPARVLGPGVQRPEGPPPLPAVTLLQGACHLWGSSPPLTEEAKGGQPHRPHNEQGPVQTENAGFLFKNHEVFQDGDGRAGHKCESVPAWALHGCRGLTPVMLTLPFPWGSRLRRHGAREAWTARDPRLRGKRAPLRNSQREGP